MDQESKWSAKLTALGDQLNKLSEEKATLEDQLGVQVGEMEKTENELAAVNRRFNECHAQWKQAYGEAIDELVPPSIPLKERTVIFHKLLSLGELLTADHESPEQLTKMFKLVIEITSAVKPKESIQPGCSSKTATSDRVSSGETAAKRRRMDSSKMDSNKDEAEDSAGDSFGGVMCQGIAQDDNPEGVHESTEACNELLTSPSGNQKENNCESQD